MEQDESLEYYCEQVRTLIWSGFFDERDLRAYLEDLQLDEDAEPHREAIASHAAAEITKKRAAEASWPERTDCDRLDDAFAALEIEGILALHNAGYARSDAHGDAMERLAGDADGMWTGYCYYHGQDVERVVEGGGLMIGFDALRDDPDAVAAIGRRVLAALRAVGLVVDWSGDPEVRIALPTIDWKRRTLWRDPPAAPRRLRADRRRAAAKPGFFARLFGRGS